MSRAHSELLVIGYELLVTGKDELRIDVVSGRPRTNNQQLELR